MDIVDLLSFRMKKTILVLALFLVATIRFSQSSAQLPLDSLAFQPTNLMVKLKPLHNSQFLEIAGRSFDLNIDAQPPKLVERSINGFDLKPLPPIKPYFDFTDRNHFESIYKTNNPAFYEALKNTAGSQIYNPFSLHKQL